MTTYRVAKIEDIKELCRLLNELFTQEAEFTPDEVVQERALAKIISDESIGEIFVASHDGEIVAMVNILYTFSTALGAKVAILEDMIVDERYRGQDIGSSLMDFALKRIKAKGCKRITLLSDSDNFKAHKFYEKQGFTKSAMIPFRKVIDDAQA
ncbi:GNAT family N-acetyltransferase [Sulfurimonas sp.]|uniref:GNAT family N-acetyltransferase n=1 Tax=Sulfurimonas sp. TaxID=2022749 RepID=UPI003D1414A7